MLILSSPVEAERLFQENAIALLYFGSESCGVCRAVQPKLEALLAEYPGIAAAKVDSPQIDQLRRTASLPSSILVSRIGSHSGSKAFQPR